MTLSFFKKLRREKLTAAESNRVTRELRAVMASYPAPASAKMWSPGLYRLHRFSLSLVAIVVVIIATSGTALAAERALPGDALYPIKIKVNERVRTGLAISSEAKVRWEMQQAERRLDEAEQLTTQGRFNEQKRIELEARLKTHVGQLTNRITELKNRGQEGKAERLRVQFSKELKTHEKKLRTLIDQADVPSTTSTTSTSPRQPKNGRPARAFLQLIETTTNPVQPSSPEIISSSTSITVTPTVTSTPREPDEIKVQHRTRIRFKTDR